MNKAEAEALLQGGAAPDLDQLVAAHETKATTEGALVVEQALGEWGPTALQELELAAAPFDAELDSIAKDVDDGFLNPGHAAEPRRRIAQRRQKAVDAAANTLREHLDKVMAGQFTALERPQPLEPGQVLGHQPEAAYLAGLQPAEGIETARRLLTWYAKAGKSPEMLVATLGSLARSPAYGGEDLVNQRYALFNLVEQAKSLSKDWRAVAAKEGKARVRQLREGLTLLAKTFEGGQRIRESTRWKIGALTDFGGPKSAAQQLTDQLDG
jgi:hypothetical protein